MTERIVRIGTIRGLVGGMNFSDETDGTNHRAPRWTAAFKGKRVRIAVEEIGEPFIPDLESARRKIAELKTEVDDLRTKLALAHNRIEELGGLA